MLSDHEITELTKAAKVLAEKTSDANVCRLAEVTLREHEKLTGDERTEVGIIHDAYVAEMQRRGLN